MLSRRTILLAGGASAVIGGAGLVAYAIGPGQGRARAPWTQAGESFGDPRLDALAYAILAPNPHNRQPWMFDLVGDDQILVFCDLDKRLPETDPLDRQITIGFGCMLELLRLAAAQKGFRAEIESFPDGEPQPRLGDVPIARVSFIADPDMPRDPLFANILTRRSTKEPFDTARPVDPEHLARVMDAAKGDLDAGSSLDAAKVKTLTDLAWLGWMIEYETPATRRESIDLMRFGNRAVVADPDGIDLGGLSMGLMSMAGMISPGGLDTPGSGAYNFGIDMYREIIHSAMGFVWVTSPDNTRRTQLAAGKTWVRMNLAAQQAGLCIHPMSQILQEFPQMAEPYAAVREELGVASSGALQMLGRLGYTAFPPASPRWPLETKLITQAT